VAATHPELRECQIGHHFNPCLEGLGDLPIPDLIALVHSAVGANETYELEWKLEFPLGTRTRRAALAKHIIAFANRDPDRAVRTFKGHAFLLIGVEPGAWGSAPGLDPAELVQQAVLPACGWMGTGGSRPRVEGEGTRTRKAQVRLDAAAASPFPVRRPTCDRRAPEPTWHAGSARPFTQSDPDSAIHYRGSQAPMTFARESS